MNYVSVCDRLVACLFWAVFMRLFMLSLEEILNAHLSGLFQVHVTTCLKTLPTHKLKLLHLFVRMNILWP